MDVPTGFLSAEQTRRILGVKDNTLRLWAEAGNIPYIRNGEKGSHRYYNVREYLRNKGDSIVKERIRSSERRKICYCRVSTRQQRDDLQRQVDYLRGRYPDYQFIKDIGSGINFKRKGLKTILEYAIKGEIEQVVVAYKDRLCRFGFDLVKWIIEEFSSGEILVLNQSNCSPEQEAVTDVLSILHVFSAKINGLRKYKQQIKQEFRPEHAEIIFAD